QLQVKAVDGGILVLISDNGTGFVPNPFNSQCLAPVSTPTINGIPCIPSNLGLCQSFVQNQQPPRVPQSTVG
ncbi:MAG: hypothetical protein EBU54_17525, partial [Mycobacteriaceae bacterium]|nr:hypothetical protein [Mycobacteriaceae bacterium]